MCGVFGYIGDTPIQNTLVLDGLRMLEYRGYDSWGIGMLEEDGIRLIKDIGRVPDHIPDDASDIVIGHTRWATHGGVTPTNSHPHLGCDATIMVVHNGIIENEREMREKLVKDHTIVSETDSELLAHMYEAHGGGDAAVLKVVNAIQGHNAFVLVDAQKKVMYVYANGSPVILGASKDGHYVASDIVALHPHVERIHYMRDGQLVKITSSKTTVLIGDQLSWEELPEMSSVSELVEEHYMYQEILHQPVMLSKNSIDMRGYERTRTLLSAADTIYIVGCGSAYYTCMYGEQLLRDDYGVKVRSVVGSEAENILSYATKDDVVILVTQSGETMDTVEAMKLAKSHGATTVGLVNVETSRIAREVDVLHPLKTGVEIGVASTKAVMSMLLSYHHLSSTRNIYAKKLSAALESFVKRVQDDGSLSSLARSFEQENSMFMLGKGLGYPLALESALKMKEIAYIHAEGFAAGELKHGVIALVEKGTPVVAYVMDDDHTADMLSACKEVASRGARVIGVSPTKHEVFDEHVSLGDEYPLFEALVSAQMLSYHTAVFHGHDPDKPRNLAKSVTVK